MHARTVVAAALGMLVLAGGLMLQAGPAGAPAPAEPKPAAAQAAAGEKLVVYELFTSQGCSSCPPADELATMVARDPGLIVISRPVTYWDRLGWKDSLASPANTALQRAYAARGLAGYSGVYTPQVVVNGRSGQVGSQADSVRSLIAAARELAGPQLAYDRTSGTATIAGAAGASATLSLVGVDTGEQVAIARGENGGRQLHYTNVYKGERRIGDWRGGAASFPVALRDRQIAGADQYFLLLREGISGPILAAARL